VRGETQRSYLVALDLNRQSPGSAGILPASAGTGRPAGGQGNTRIGASATPAAWKAALPAMGFCDSLQGAGGIHSDEHKWHREVGHENLTH